jgi:hypothetical protein
MKAYKHNKKKWGEMLLEVGFKPEYLDKINEYASVHTQYELINILQSDQGFPESTLPYALRVLLMIQNKGYLDKIHFVDNPSGELVVPIETVVTRYYFDSDVLWTVDDKEGYMSHKFTVDTAENLIKKLVTHEVYVYILFSDMKAVNNVLHIFHRFGIENNQNGGDWI